MTLLWWSSPEEGIGRNNTEKLCVYLKYIKCSAWSKTGLNPRFIHELVVYASQKFDIGGSLLSVFKKKKTHSNFFLNSFLRWSPAGALQQIPLPFQWTCYNPRSARQRHVSGDHGGNEDHGHPRWRADRYEYARNKGGNRPCLELFCSNVLIFLFWFDLLAFFLRDFVGFVLLVSIPALPAPSKQCANNKILVALEWPTSGSVSRVSDYRVNFRTSNW